MSKQIELSTGTYNLKLTVGALKRLKDAGITLSSLNDEYAVVGLCHAFAVVANIRNIEQWMNNITPDDIKIIIQSMTQELTDFFLQISPAQE